MVHSKNAIFVGLLMVAIIALVTLTMVQAQTTPTTPAAPGAVGDFYSRLKGNNLVIVTALETDNIPILSGSADLKAALNQIKAASPYRAFAVVGNVPDEKSVHVLISDGSAGEIEVWRYTSRYNNFELKPCGGFLSSLNAETSDIGPLLAEYSNSTLNLSDFLLRNDCDETSSARYSPYTSPGGDNTFGSDNTIQSLLKTTAESIRSAYSSTPNAFISISSTVTAPGGGTTAVAAPPAPPTTVACDSGGTKLGEILLDDKGKFNIFPQFVSGNELKTIDLYTPLLAPEGDIRLAGYFSIMAMVNSVKVEKYRLRIVDYGLNNDGQLTLKTQLCQNNAGTFTGHWTRANYYTNVKGADKYTLVKSDIPSNQSFSTNISAAVKHPSLIASYVGPTHQKIQVHYYIDSFSSKKLATIGFDASADIQKTDYRFSLEMDTFNNLQEQIPEFKDLSPDAIKGKIIMELIGKGNLNGHQYVVSPSSTQKLLALSSPEGPLATGQNYNDKYWKVAGIASGGEYKLTITLDTSTKKYAPIERKIMINPIDLSTNNVTDLTTGDIKKISISKDEIRTDYCIVCTDLRTCMLCVDTRFVSKITD